MHLRCHVMWSMHLQLVAGGVGADRRLRLEPGAQAAPVAQDVVQGSAGLLLLLLLRYRPSRRLPSLEVRQAPL